ncbi:MAG: Pr6Pr family membrane protein [Anaerolineae bacterium]|jgi:hypothetical protein|nr:Pr6Pr family membrane protein [Anaerolineae bacterium]
MERRALRRWVWAAIALIATFGVVGQVYASATRPEAPASFLAVLVEVFNYWTVQTNTLVALACGVPLLFPTSAAGRFFTKPVVRMALAIYIATTGIVYLILLAGLWSPTGFQRLVDIILHYVTPLLYPLSWLLLDDHGQLRWRDVPVLLVYPLIFVTYSLIRGAIVDFYPYPFIDVNALGYPQVLINSAALAVIFMLAGAALVAVDRALGRRQQVAATA